MTPFPAVHSCIHRLLHLRPAVAMILGSYLMTKVSEDEGDNEDVGDEEEEEYNASNTG